MFMERLLCAGPGKQAEPGSRRPVGMGLKLWAAGAPEGRAGG